MAHYNRLGQCISPREWTRLFSDPEYQHLDRTEFPDDGFSVSTVWLGINHNFGDGPPLIFETMIFGPEHSELNESMWRYSTEAAARAGHDQAVARVREAVRWA